MNSIILFLFGLVALTAHVHPQRLDEFDVIKQMNQCLAINNEAEQIQCVADALVFAVKNKIAVSPQSVPQGIKDFFQAKGQEILHILANREAQAKRPNQRFILSLASTAFTLGSTAYSLSSAWYLLGGAAIGGTVLPPLIRGFCNNFDYFEQAAMKVGEWKDSAYNWYSYLTGGSEAEEAEVPARFKRDIITDLKDEAQKLEEAIKQCLKNKDKTAAAKCAAKELETNLKAAAKKVTDLLEKVVAQIKAYFKDNDQEVKTYIEGTKRHMQRGLQDYANTAYNVGSTAYTVASFAYNMGSKAWSVGAVALPHTIRAACVSYDYYQKAQEKVTALKDNAGQWMNSFMSNAGASRTKRETGDAPTEPETPAVDQPQVDPAPVDPAPVGPVPSPVEPVPSPVEPVPEPVEPVPAPVPAPIPAPVEPVPAPVEPVPALVEPVPAPVNPVPAPAPVNPVPAPTPEQVETSVKDCLKNGDTKAKVKCVADVLGSDIVEAKKKVESLLKSKYQNVKDFLKAKGDQIKDIISHRQDYFDKIKDKATELKNEAKEKYEEVKEAAKNWFDKHFGSRSKRETGDAPTEPETPTVDNVPEQPQDPAPVDPAPVDPTPVDPVPAPVEPVPAPEPVEPAPVEPVPEPVEPVPAPVEPVPAPVEPIPAPVEPVPAPVDPVPAPVPAPIPAPVPAPTPEQVETSVKDCLKSGDTKAKVKCVADVLGSDIVEAKQKVQALLKSKYQNVKDFLKAKGDQIKDVISHRQDYFDKIKDKATELKNDAKEKYNEMKEAAKNWFDTHFGKRR